jgi:hypothetical protein
MTFLVCPLSSPYFMMLFMLFLAPRQSYFFLWQQAASSDPHLVFRLAEYLISLFSCFLY